MASPMAHMRPPRVPEESSPVLTDDQLRELLQAYEGQAHENRRDMANLRLFLDTGARRAEIATATRAT